MALFKRVLWFKWGFEWFLIKGCFLNIKIVVSFWWSSGLFWSLRTFQDIGSLSIISKVPFLIFNDDSFKILSRRSFLTKSKSRFFRWPLIFRSAIRFFRVHIFKIKARALFFSFYVAHFLLINTMSKIFSIVHFLTFLHPHLYQSRNKLTTKTKKPKKKPPLFLNPNPHPLPLPPPPPLLFITNSVK